MTEILKTKYGKCTLNRDSYFKINTGKNNGKLLHRVIFEDFYNIKLDEEFPKGVHIHHIDGNRTNNEIWNLEPISIKEHQRMHQLGKQNNCYGVCSQRRKENISKARTVTGFFRVYKKKNNIYKQGFSWCYHYYKDSAKRQTHITSVDLLKLKQKILAKGLDWFIIDEDIAKSVCDEYGYELNEVC